MSKDLKQPGSTQSDSLEEKMPFLERVIFKNRLVLVSFFVLMTLALGYQAAKLRPDASFLKMIPTGHPYVQNFLENLEDLKLEELS